MKVVGVDFETEAIGPRPGHFPPKSVGLAVKVPGRLSRYLSWGHPSQNNSRREAATNLLRKVFVNNEIVCHNAAFDLQVSERWHGLPFPRKYHCTQILAFLHNPHEPSFELKKLAPKYCGFAADARDELKEWVLANIPEARKKKSEWGAYICRAPGDIVGKYAKADVEMTLKLFKFLHAKVTKDLGMLPAYQRELDLVPIMITLERRGVDVDVHALEKDLPGIEKALETIERKIRLRLKAPGLDIDKKGALADALDAAGKITDWPLTKKGLDLQDAGMLDVDDVDDYRSTSHKLLKRALNDSFLYHLLVVRGKLATSLRTFARAWTERNNNGKIFISWASTRHDKSESGALGARTGRLSSSPNFQNVAGAPKLTRYEIVKGDSAEAKKEKKQLLEIYSLLPNLRKYVIPGTNNAFVVRDYSQQEMRLLAHFENGPLLAEYLSNPKLDIHAHVAELIYRITGIDMRAKEDRTPVKVINFGRIYGMGKDKLADTADIDVDLAGMLMRAHKLALPGVTALDDDLKQIGMDGGLIKTLGGRKYAAEEPRFVVKNKITGDGRWYRFEYKLLNYLIQGSAADMLKIALTELFRKGLDVVLTIHDEIVVCAPQNIAHEAMRELKETMESIKLDLPVLSDGEILYNNWGEMKK